MPPVDFICPDQEKIQIVECHKKCRMDQRCMTLPTLVEIAKYRKWNGKASTTQCLNGTRMELLKISLPYAVDPQNMAFALLGSKHHSQLDKNDNGEWLLEESFPEDTITGILDCYESESRTLTDYKTWGSFAVAKNTGLSYRMIDDPSGEVYKSNGKWGKKGDPKQIKQWYVDPDKADAFEVDMQLNNYRIKIEKAGFPVDTMHIQATVRDGGTYIAKDRGISKNIYLISVRRLPNDEVIAYFKSKSDALIEAIENGLAPRCNDRENWEGRRCDGYCDVRDYCDQMNDGMTISAIKATLKEG